VLGGDDGAAAVRAFNETVKWPRKVNPNKRSWKNDVSYLMRPREEWGSLTAASITDDDVAEVLDIIAENAPVSANRTQSILHTLFNRARQPGRKYVPSNPVAGLHQRGGKEKKRDRILSDDEIRALWWGLDHPEVPCERPIKLAMKFILTTMVRPYQSAYAEISELSGLGTAEGLYELPPERAKRFRPVLVPLSDLAQEIIDEAIADKDQLVLFPSKFSDGDVSIRRDSIAQALNGKKNDKRKSGKVEDRVGIREFLKMDHFTAHDLWRTAATLARRAGAPRPDVKAMLYHINGDVTAIYDMYDMLAEKRIVVATLAAELRRVIGDGPSKSPLS
jgi:integrase